MSGWQTPSKPEVAIPDPTRWKLERRVNQRRQDRWLDLRDFAIRYRANFAYITGTTDDGPLSLCRLRYIGSPDEWGFSYYLASKDGYEDSVLPSGRFTGTPEVPGSPHSISFPNSEPQAHTNLVPVLVRP